MSVAQIQHVTTGLLNTVNDPFPGSLGSSSQWPPPIGYPGQLGKAIYFDADTIRYDSTVGTLYPGHYTYVQLSTDSPVPVIGQAAFWIEDAEADPSLFAVTAEEDSFTLTDAQFAGVFINVPTLGNYCYIQRSGLVYVKYRASITGTKATGRPVFLAAAGGADAGLFDVVDTMPGTTPILNYYVGQAWDLPADGGLKRITLNNVTKRNT